MSGTPRFALGSLAGTIVAIAVASMLLAVGAQAGTQTCFVTNGVCVTNGGTTGASATAGGGFSVSSAAITQVSGAGGAIVSGSNLGSISFSTGGLTSGSLGSGGTFGAGSLTITLTTAFNGFTGTLFTGTFGSASGGVDWIFTGTQGSGKNKQYMYELIGPVTGTFEGNIQVTGQTAQFFFSSKTPFSGGTLTLTSGDTTLVTPEPAALGLMGTGMVGIGLVAKRRTKARPRHAKPSAGSMAIAANHASRNSVPSAVQAQVATV